jgi:hypothetical protein
MRDELISWLLESDEPWTRFRTHLDLLDTDPYSPVVQSARAEMIDHPQITSLIENATSWPGYGLKRHNDAKHPLHMISTLADFGLKAEDAGMDVLISRVLSQQDENGPFQTYSHLYERFAGVEGEHWTWMMCDAPTILYALLSFDLEEDPQVQKALQYLRGITRENGWPCAAGSPMKENFKGPGKREDPCPYANLIMLKALAQVGEDGVSEEATRGLEVLLQHWDHAYDHKLFLFATGSDFRKVKYPFVWYDILHVAEVLSLYPEVHHDPRFQALLSELTSQANEDGKYIASSMYTAWKGWSFANKKQPSPWLTFLVLRVMKRATGKP